MYLVFARKYRPRRFEDVVGQEHVAITLQNAVRNDRVGHAYLFCGSRGVGKTTMARILACALNCEKGPTPDPCGECDPCIRIAGGNYIDVLEIDGASNRRVEETQEILQNVGYAAAHSRYKVYYIDEVHMLSTHAFNALLKTLEEPPPHVKFIFSTTDPQQLPETVRSRCQRFDFRRIADTQIIKHLRFVCENEGLVPEKGSLEFIARAARGSMRDALGHLDQLASFDSKNVHLEDVLKVLGAVATQRLTEIVDALAQGETGRALSAVHEILFSGVDVLDLADQLSEYVRDLMVASYCGTEHELLAGSAADAETLARQLKLFPTEQFLYMIQILREAKLRARRETTGRLALELAIVKLSRLGELVPIEQALRQLSGGPPAGNPVGPTADVAQGDHADSGVSRRIEMMKQRLENRNRRSAPAEEPTPPEGMDRDRSRQMRDSAPDPETADALLGDQPLLKAFREADEVFGLSPVQVKRRKAAAKQEPNQKTDEQGESLPGGE